MGKIKSPRRHKVFKGGITRVTTLFCAEPRRSAPQWVKHPIRITAEAVAAYTAIFSSGVCFCALPYVYIRIQGASRYRVDNRIVLMKNNEPDIIRKAAFGAPLGEVFTFRYPAPLTDRLLSLGFKKCYSFPLSRFNGLILSRLGRFVNSRKSGGGETVWRRSRAAPKARQNGRRESSVDPVHRFKMRGADRGGHLPCACRFRRPRSGRSGSASRRSLLPAFSTSCRTPAAFGSFSSAYPLPPRNSPGVIPVTALNCLINWYSLA